MHRKVWEFAYITQALHERGMLAPGRRGLGFAVGKEPLPAFFAGRGCEILATDLDTREAAKSGWVQGGQHADARDGLNSRGHCSPQEFEARVAFRFLDMRELPDDVGHFDFIWSSCSLEHLGSIALGERFVYESLRYLKPGGVAVHTTEYNLSSNWFTTTRGHAVIFRRRDIERIARNVRRLGFAMELDLREGRLPLDRIVDPPPHTGLVHLRLRLGWFTATSMGMVIERPASP
jgi:SAM-dependent methyltransferase